MTTAAEAKVRAKPKAQSKTKPRPARSAPGASKGASRSSSKSSCQGASRSSSKSSSPVSSEEPPKPNGRNAASHKPGKSQRRTTVSTDGHSQCADINRRVLDWYDRERRHLPWRFAPGETADPYRVWLSEIMLQQTTVKAVVPFFEKFTALWPTVDDLAAADEEAVLSAWAGLGYYSRARNLHACARKISGAFQGRFPRSEKELLNLPGIGPYTAAAISAIAFDTSVVPIDGNIERVTSRLFAIETPLPGAKPEIKTAAAKLAPAARAGDFAQALMDLGATVCTPRRPSCLMCPVQPHCKGHAAGLAETLPRKAERAERPVRRGTAFVALREDGAVLLRKRSDTGLLARMLEVPSTDWVRESESTASSARAVPVKAKWLSLPGTVVHTFTHFRLELDVRFALVDQETSLTIWADGARCRWVHRRDLDRQALPSVMKKILAHALNHQM
ncbi:MAG: A/G-specific adenine glycosylase [Pseudomonadota bacterium]